MSLIGATTFYSIDIGNYDVVQVIGVIMPRNTCLFMAREVLMRPTRNPVIREKQHLVFAKYTYETYRNGKYTVQI